ncbi:hypothetical protein EDB84DRAFT_1681625 [Lactarius hengduanensis]|nr:hypothetical protein EDB84DRAFT_1681625 [Lactarius hengduanensis]
MSVESVNPADIEVIYAYGYNDQQDREGQLKNSKWKHSFVTPAIRSPREDTSSREDDKSKSLQPTDHDGIVILYLRIPVKECGRPLPQESVTVCVREEGFTKGKAGSAAATIDGRGEQHGLSHLGVDCGKTRYNQETYTILEKSMLQNKKSNMKAEYQGHGAPRFLSTSDDAGHIERDDDLELTRWSRLQADRAHICIRVVKRSRKFALGRTVPMRGWVRSWQFRQDFQHQHPDPGTGSESRQHSPLSRNASMTLHLTLRLPVSQQCRVQLGDSDDLFPFSTFPVGNNASLGLYRAVYFFLPQWITSKIGLKIGLRGFAKVTIMAEVAWLRSGFG